MALRPSRFERGALPIQRISPIVSIVPESRLIYTVFMKKLSMALLICFSVIFLSGCGPQAASTQSTSSITELSGTLVSKTTDGYILQTETGLVTVDSMKLKLDQYLKKKIDVKGMYSGSTLYIDELTAK